VRTAEDLDGLDQTEGPMLIDAKVSRDYCAEWLEEAFK
jgi:hypothetical protein